MYAIITLSSVTSAKRVERSLTDIGISCRTQHTPKIISQYGCSYSVRINEKDTQKALKICKDIGVKVRGVFLEKTSLKGKTEYEKIN